MITAIIHYRVDNTRILSVHYVYLKEMFKLSRINIMVTWNVRSSRIFLIPSEVINVLVSLWYVCVFFFFSFYTLEWIFQRLLGTPSYENVVTVHHNVTNSRLFCYNPMVSRMLTWSSDTSAKCVAYERRFGKHFGAGGSEPEWTQNRWTTGEWKMSKILKGTTTISIWLRFLFRIKC